MKIIPKLIFTNMFACKLYYINVLNIRKGTLKNVKLLIKFKSFISKGDPLIQHV